MVSDQPDLSTLLLRKSKLPIIGVLNYKVNGHSHSPVYKACIFLCRCIHMNKPNSKKTNSSPKAPQTYSIPKSHPSRGLGLKSNALTLGQISWPTAQWNMPFLSQGFSKGDMLHSKWVTGPRRTLPALNACAFAKTKAGPMTHAPQSQASTKVLPLPGVFSQEGNPSHHKRKIRK